MNILPEYVIIPSTSFDIIRLAALERFEKYKADVMSETDPQQLRHKMKYFCALQNAINDVDYNGVSFQPQPRNISFMDTEDIDPDRFKSINDDDYDISLKHYDEETKGEAVNKKQALAKVKERTSNRG